MMTTLIIVVAGAISSHLFTKFTRKEKLTPKQELIKFTKTLAASFIFVYTAGGFTLFEIKKTDK